ncbi:MAG: acyl carrier protein [Ruminococcaceae bacterium]|nr:acyl carrier protein [Oscillospiraceae bacterium]
MFNKVKDIICKNFNNVKPADVTLESELAKDLGINSLQLADLILALEEEFEIEIEDKAIKKMIRVKDLVAYLEDNVA